MLSNLLKHFNLQLFAEANSGVKAGVATPQRSAAGATGTDDDDNGSFDFDGGNKPDELDETDEDEFEDDSSGASGIVGQKGSPSKQGKDTNAAFAQMRRENEQLKREAAERRAKETQEESARQQAKQQKDLEDIEQRIRDEYGMEPDLLNSLVTAKVKSDPEFQELKQSHERIRAEQHQQFLWNQFTELQTEYPNIKNPHDVDADTWSKYNEGRNGLSLSETYAAVHRKELAGTAKVKGEREAISKIKSKDHLGTEKSTGGQIKQDVDVSEEKMRIWNGFGYKDPKDIKNRERKYIK